MIKSLQSKMILVMFVFILFVILFSAFFSIIKMEQVYYRGFIEEMLNTISSFGINVNPEKHGFVNADKGMIGQIEIDNIDKIIENFSIYFSLNNTRDGSILDENYKILYSSKENGLKANEIVSIQKYSNEKEVYRLENDNKLNEYYFIYYIRDAKTNKTKYTIIINQDKGYINSQLGDIRIFYISSLIIISIITVIVSRMLAFNVTKPIEFIRKKAQLIAAR